MELPFLALYFSSWLTVFFTLFYHNTAMKRCSKSVFAWVQPYLFYHSNLWWSLVIVVDHLRSRFCGKVRKIVLFDHFTTNVAEYNADKFIGITVNQNEPNSVVWAGQHHFTTRNIRMPCMIPYYTDFIWFVHLIIASVCHNAKIRMFLLKSMHLRILAQ